MLAERVPHNTRAQAALSRPGPQTDALRDVLRSLIEYDDVNRHLGGMVTALDLRYPVSDDHPLTGRRVPDVTSYQRCECAVLLRPVAEPRAGE